MNSLRYTLGLRLYGKERVFGPGIAELMERIDREKSIRKATITMGMAYSKAWAILKRAEAELGFALVTSDTGGKGGGGSDLTPEGRNFLQSYRRFETTLMSLADEVFMEIYGEQD